MTVDWEHVAREAGLRPRPRSAPGAIEAAERAVGSTFSGGLRALYEHCDGLVDEWGYQYVLSLAEVVEQNRRFRADYRDLHMPFDRLLIFGQLGNGDLLFQPETGRVGQVYIWDHEDDSRKWYARDVPEAIRRLAGIDPYR